MAKKRDPHHPLKGFAGPISSPGKSRSKTGAARLKNKKVNIRGISATVEHRMTLRDLFEDRRASRGETPETKPKRVFGAYKGKFRVRSEFFEPLSPDELKAWGSD